jgi:hypothetical protein
VKKNKRAATVFAGLLGVLTVTSALLLALAPAPLRPDEDSSRGIAMLAAERHAPLTGVLETRTPVQKGRWQYIFVRHSKTDPGDQRRLGSDLADHFVVASGPGSFDGAVQMTARWSNQVSAGAPRGASEIHPKCISIVLVGDLDRTVPTPNQLARTTQLVRTLQQELGIPAENVLVLDGRGSPAGVGRFFPTEAFADSLLQ